MIEAVGSGVTEFEVGQRVAAYTTGGSYAEKVGADDVIDDRREDFAAAVDALTEGAGVDVILDSVAGDVAELPLEEAASAHKLVESRRSAGKVLLVPLSAEPERRAAAAAVRTVARGRPCRANPRKRP